MLATCVHAQELFEAIQQLDLPPNFLDEIVDELGGPGQVRVLP